MSVKLSSLNMRNSIGQISDQIPIKVLSFSALMRKAMVGTVMLTSMSLVSACSPENETVNNQAETLSEQQVLTAAKQQDIDNIAQSLQVKYQQIDNRPSAECDPNIENGNCFRVDLVLTANKAIKANDWQIYFSQITPFKNQLAMNLLLPI